MSPLEQQALATALMAFYDDNPDEALALHDVCTKLAVSEDDGQAVLDQLVTQRQLRRVHDGDFGRVVWRHAVALPALERPRSPMWLPHPDMPPVRWRRSADAQARQQSRHTRSSR